MPLWNIQYTPGVFPDEEVKIAISNAVRDLYVANGLPAYYVHVLFTPMPKGEYFNHLGDSTTASGVGVVLLGITHIARKSAAEEVERNTGFKNKVDAIMGPYVTAKGHHFEYGVIEGPPYYWRINGIDPPEAFGPEDKEKAAANRAKLDEIHRRTAGGH